MSNVKRTEAYESMQWCRSGLPLLVRGDLHRRAVPVVDKPMLSAGALTAKKVKLV